MQIVRRASAGTLESSDAYIEIEPIDAGLQLEIESVVYQQFGNQIQSMATEMLATFEIQNAHVRINDRGALDCVLRARLETAIRRSLEG